MVLVMLGCTLLSFAVVNLLPGDLVHTILGEGYNAQAAAALRLKLGLDKPMIVQYPSFWEMSHWRSPFGLQSELTTHESPISLPQPKPATTIASNRYLMSGRILAVDVTPGNTWPVACKVHL